jgi:hypothetical protein
LNLVANSYCSSLELFKPLNFCGTKNRWPKGHYKANYDKAV